MNQSLHQQLMCRTSAIRVVIRRLFGGDIDDDGKLSTGKLASFGGDVVVPATPAEDVISEALGNVESSQPQKRISVSCSGDTTNYRVVEKSSTEYQ